MKSIKIIGVKAFDRTGGVDDFVEFDLIEDVNFIYMYNPTEHSSKVPAYHTSYGSLLALSTLRDAGMAYKQYGFEAYDKSNIVNVNKIKELKEDKDGTKVIFVDGTVTFVRKKLKK